eukprot:gene30359-35364_t
MVLAPFDLDDDLFSDVRVVFSISKASSEDGGHVLGAQNQADLSFLAHKHILANSSPVLKMLLLRAAKEQRGEEQQTMSSPKALDKSASGQQVSASRTLLLVLLYRLADRLEEKGCLEECATAISKLEGKDLGSADDINCICSLLSSAPLLCDKPPIDGLLTKCGKHLIIQHPDATALCKGPPKELEPFLRLTFHAMLALISSDLLKAESENDVLVLACIWVRHNTPSQSQLSLLSQRIRLKHLTPSFLADLNAIAPWFAATPQMLFKLLPLQGCSLHDMQHAGWNGPPAWFGAQSVPSNPSTTPWAVQCDEEHISKLIEAATGQGLGGLASDAMDIAIPGAQGGRVYHKGYYFQPAIDVQRQPTDPFTFDVLFALRVSRALEDSGDAKEVMEDKPADAHQLDQATWDSEMFPLPVCVQANIIGGDYGAITVDNRQPHDISLLSMNQSWMHPVLFYTETVKASTWAHRWNSFGPLSVNWNLSGSC